MRIALAQLAFRPGPIAAIQAVVSAMEKAATLNADLVCTPENYIPGMRGVGLDVGAPDVALGRLAREAICDAAKRTGAGAIVGIERPAPGGIFASAMVVDRRGSILGYQDKVQIDPVEEGTFIGGVERRIFEIDGVRCGVVICHDGWRYPETVRACARLGAQVVFHLHYSPANGRQRTPAFASSAGSMHEKAAICRAAENTIFFASVNFAIANPVAGSAVIDPCGSVIAADTSGTERLLLADIEPAQATGFLARRLRPVAT